MGLQTQMIPVQKGKTRSLSREQPRRGAEGGTERDHRGEHWEGLQGSTGRGRGAADTEGPGAGWQVSGIRARVGRCPRAGRRREPESRSGEQVRRAHPDTRRLRRGPRHDRRPSSGEDRGLDTSLSAKRRCHLGEPRQTVQGKRLQRAAAAVQGAENAQPPQTNFPATGSRADGKGYGGQGLWDKDRGAPRAWRDPTDCWLRSPGGPPATPVLTAPWPGSGPPSATWACPQRPPLATTRHRGFC